MKSFLKKSEVTENFGEKLTEREKENFT